MENSKYCKSGIKQDFKRGSKVHLSRGSVIKESFLEEISELCLKGRQDFLKEEPWEKEELVGGQKEQDEKRKIGDHM